MDNHKLIKVLTLSLIGLIVVVMNAYLLHAQGKKSMPDASDKEQIPLSQLLFELGETHNYFFTIEEAWKEGEPINSLESSLVPKGPKQTALRERLEELQRTVPNLTFKINEKNPRIIHIIDGRLAQHKGYGLVGALNTMDFEGKIRDLVTAISNQGVAVSPQNSFPVGIPMAIDWTTVVHVKGEGLKVRDALTNFIPLDGYNRIIWVATTKLGPGEITFINFRGSRVTTQKR